VKLRFRESQRDSVIQPKVAEVRGRTGRARLPWDNRRNDFLPQRGCVTRHTVDYHNPVGVGDVFDLMTQGSSFLATAGLDDVAPLGQTRWPEQRRIVAELDALQAEVDAFNRLQAESRQSLHPILDALLFAIRGQIAPQDPTDEQAEKLLEQLNEKGT
jgi:hypothetical protein